MDLPKMFRQINKGWVFPDVLVALALLVIFGFLTLQAVHDLQNWPEKSRQRVIQKLQKNIGESWNDFL